MTDTRAKILSDMAAEDAKYIADIPTQAMIDAGMAVVGDETVYKSHCAMLRDIYLAMQAVAPNERSAAIEAVPDALVMALVNMACFNDEGANEHLAATGSYGMFDEPGSVQIAREALTIPRTTIEEAEARGAAKERERLVKRAESIGNTEPEGKSFNEVSDIHLAFRAWQWLRAQGGDNAG